MTLCSPPRPTLPAALPAACSDAPLRSTGPRTFECCDRSSFLDSCSSFAYRGQETQVPSCTGGRSVQRRLNPPHCGSGSGETSRQKSNVHTIAKSLRRRGCCRSCTAGSGGTQSGRPPARSGRSRCTGWPGAAPRTRPAGALQRSSAAQRPPAIRWIASFACQGDATHICALLHALGLCRTHRPRPLRPPAPQAPPPLGPRSAPAASRESIMRQYTDMSPRLLKQTGQV